MSEKTRKPSKSARVQPGTINQTRVSLQDLPEKAKEFLSLQEAIWELCVPFEAALIKGYGYQELAAML